MGDRGRLYAVDAAEPYRFGGVWTRHETSGPLRLVIGPSGRLLELLLRMAERLPEPLFVLLVLGVPRATTEGRYESEALTHAELSDLLHRYSDFLETDPQDRAMGGRDKRRGTSRA